MYRMVYSSHLQDYIALEHFRCILQKSYIINIHNTANTFNTKYTLATKQFAFHNIKDLPMKITILLMMDFAVYLTIGETLFFTKGAVGQCQE